MALAQVIIKDTDTTVLTVPAGKRYAITTIMICNTANINKVTGTNFNMHFVKQGDPTGNNLNKVVNTLDLPPGETFTFDSEKIILDTGDRIVFTATPVIDPDELVFRLTDLSATVSFLEV